MRLPPQLVVLPSAVSCQDRTTESDAEQAGVALQSELLHSRVLLGMLFLVGITALGSGSMMIADPMGQTVGLPLTLLRHSPFESFLVPGLILTLLVGGSHVIAAVALWRGSPLSMFLAVAAGLILVIWLAVQIVLIGGPHLLQVAYMILGLATFTLGLSEL